MRMSRHTIIVYCAPWRHKTSVAFREHKILHITRACLAVFSICLRMRRSRVQIQLLSSLGLKSADYCTLQSRTLPTVGENMVALYKKLSLLRRIKITMNCSQ